MSSCRTAMRQLGRAIGAGSQPPCSAIERSSTAGHWQDRQDACVCGSRCERVDSCLPRTPDSSAHIPMNLLMLRRKRRHLAERAAPGFTRPDLRFLLARPDPHTAFVPGAQNLAYLLTLHTPLPEPQTHPFCLTTYNLQFYRGSRQTDLIRQIPFEISSQIVPPACFIPTYRSCPDNYTPSS